MNQPATPIAPARRTMTYNQITSCPDMEQDFLQIFEQCRRFTMTSLERMYGLYKAVEYVSQHNIPGTIVECGVWRGGSCMLAALALRKLNQSHRDIYLYDTFAGMTQPTQLDVDYNDDHASARLGGDWPDFTAVANVALQQVQQNMVSTGYPADRLRFVVGQVEQTIPDTIPDKIALLRLDTDWYESTRHEMQHLFPRLVSGGVIIIDDYGHWKGSRRAVDEYFAQHNIPLLLNRMDYTGRIGIKP